ncbi:MAG: F0F1 ATP synthase assembly protein I [Methylococcales bacterium]|nr:MAG: F0F1 ATP synthase assembly protein I [Methylococcales bacterium]
MIDRNFSTVSKILSYQILIILMITAGFGFFGGQQQGLSGFLGGIAAFIPNLFFALMVYKSSRQSARTVVNSFYAGESGKLLLTAVLFVMIFNGPDIKILPLLVSYIAALSVFWFALLMR